APQAAGRCPSPRFAYDGSDRSRVADDGRTPSRASSRQVTYAAPRALPALRPCKPLRTAWARPADDTSGPASASVSQAWPRPRSGGAYGGCSATRRRTAGRCGTGPGRGGTSAPFVVGSAHTYLRWTEAVNRLDLAREEKDLQDLVEELREAAPRKRRRACSKA